MTFGKLTVVFSSAPQGREGGEGRLERTGVCMGVRRKERLSHGCPVWEVTMRKSRAKGNKAGVPSV